MEPVHETISPSDRATQRELAMLMMGSRVTQMIHVAAKLGIADRLAHGPQSAEALAQATGVQPHALYRLLRGLASLGIFAETDHSAFSLTPLAEWLRSDHPGSLHGFAVLYGEPWLWQAYGALMHSVQTGQTAFHHVHGTDLFGYLAQHPEDAAVFHQAMTALSNQELEAILAAYDFSQVQHLVDVGGGEGALVAAVLQAYPTLHATLFDVAPAIERAAAQLSQRGLADRCTRVEGDFFQFVPAGGDLYVLKHVIHDWLDDESIAILKNCRAAIAAGGRLMIVERVIVEGDPSQDAKLFDINMMVSAGGLERTDQEYAALLDAAGFRLERVIPTASPVSLIEATAA